MSDNPTTIASEAELYEFGSSPPTSRTITPALRGVLVETASTGLVRYSWKLLQPLIWDLILKNLDAFEKEEQAEIGPQRPLQTAESQAALRENLRKTMSAFEDEPPFTIQRLCEVVLEPRKQYKALDKLAMSLDKLLLVTSTVPVETSPPPPPLLSSLRSVNDCPPPARNRQAVAGSGGAEDCNGNDVLKEAGGGPRSQQRQAAPAGSIAEDRGHSLGLSGVVLRQTGTAEAGGALQPKAEGW